ncbi:MAG: thiol:disulfide interchange protein DsbA [Enterobacterales bacterium]|jgi:thiol:disulfide interchange protein DsbA
MSSLAPKKLLIPGIVVLAIILFYVFYSSPNVESPATEMSESTAQVAVDTVDVVDTEVADQVVINEVADEVVINEVAAKEELKSTEQEVKAETISEAKTVETTIVETINNKNDDNDIIFVEGKAKDYIVKFPTELSKEPMVVQFFSYWCPHCYNFEPTVKLWEQQKPDSVKLLRVPVVFGRDDWRLAAKSYYIAEEMNMISEFSDLMFKTIHVDKSYPQNETDIGEIFAKLGVSNKKFVEAAKSFNVDSNLRKAEYLAKKYKVAGVPYFLVNFKYEGGEASYASQDALFRLWNYLPAIDFE